MAIRLVSAVGAVAVVACGAPIPAPARQAPAPHVVFPEVAPFRLPHTFEPTRYRARLALGEVAFTGHIEIDGTLSDAVALIWLHGVDLRVTAAWAVRGATRIALHASAPRPDQRIGLVADSPLAPGAWTLELDYRGVINAPMKPIADPTFLGGARLPPAIGVFWRFAYGHRYVFTQGEAIGARRIFPCIDEPDRKVPWQLTLDVGRTLIAASNAAIARETNLDADTKRVEFRETPPLPSYLVAFAVGPFHVIDGGRTKSGVPIRVLALTDDAIDLVPVVSLAREALDRLEAWFAMPYPYSKLDLVEAPGLGFGAMENPGLVTLDAPPPSSRETADARFGVTVRHELAHQWFGDLVTPAWWNDIWLNESFADWLATRIARTGAGPDCLDELSRGFDYLRGTPVAIRRDVANDAALEGLEFAADEAAKRGLGLIDLLEARLGEDAFQRAIRRYVAAHAGGTATTEDLFAALNGEARIDPDATTLLTAGPPYVAVELRCAASGASLHLGFDNADTTLCVAYDRDGARAERCELVGRDHRDFELPAKRCPRWVMPNAGALGFYRVIWTERMLDAIARFGWDALTPLEQRDVRRSADQTGYVLVPRRP